jgi:hypothetical protein
MDGEAGLIRIFANDLDSNGTDIYLGPTADVAGRDGGPLVCRIRCRYHPASDMPVLPALAIGLPMRAWNALVTSTPALGTSAI